MAELRKYRRKTSDTGKENYLAYYRLVTEYMIRRTGLTEEELHILCYLAQFNTMITPEHIQRYPNDMGRRASKTKFIEFIKLNMIKRLDSFKDTRGLHGVFYLTSLANEYVYMYNSLLLRRMPISCLPCNSNKDFVTAKCKNIWERNINWRGTIDEFNSKINHTY